MCENCLCGISISDHTLMYKDNIVDKVESQFDTEYKFYLYGFNIIEPTYDSILFDKSRFVLFNYCPNCGNKITF